MISSALAVPLCALISCFSLAAQSHVESKPSSCVLSRVDVRIYCPPAWNLLEESATETIIGNYVRSPDTPQHVLGGPGKAVISFMTIPAGYKDLGEWIFAARKIAPKSTEDSLAVRSHAIKGQTVTRLSAQAGPGARYSSYFFQAGSTPVLLELAYRADDPRRDEYQSAVGNDRARGKPQMSALRTIRLSPRSSTRIP